MRRLIYISRSLIDTEPSNIDPIISSSIDRNTPVGITGLLWVGGGYFAQVLEGSVGDVEATMERIRNDSRHTEVEVLLDREVRTRQFRDWAMRRAQDGEASAFMIGFALSQRTAAGQRLHEIVLANTAPHDQES